ncbi:hypothetical protein [Pengzhenrongella sicca]|uniref:Uncharacterized protein n=1 Tax=Pengzhenrongella sicca TaxID=2819238 RepID=A0A8A4ZAB3_9MICO|nr:hypothetical protein [Pengzhenrongella sicca]QTE28361.1 hypothetical protein J4E96_13355 [Pengzhenrongella sicca]
MTARHDGPGPTPDDADRASSDELAERWKAIVAELGELDVAVESAPGADPAGAAGPPVTYPVAPRGPVPPPAAAPRELSGRDWDGTAQYDAAESEVDDQEHYVPPDPGPIFGGDPLLTMAWIGAAGIPVALLVVIIVWRDAPTILLQAAGVVFALCCMLLAWRLPHSRDGADGPGAVV